jgi:16S rRNA processing protein RimM
MDTQNPLVKIGTVVNTTKIDGTLLLESVISNIELPTETAVFIGYSPQFVDKFTLSSDFKGTAAYKKYEMRLAEITNKEQAKTLKEKAVFAYKEQILEHSSVDYLPDDILGCEVYDVATHENIGEIVDIWEMPANDVWLVETAHGNLPIPVIDDVIKKIDIANRVVHIHIIDGLWDLIEPN